jgi:hypothetical protein
MITQKTIELIWRAQREITTGEQLLEDMKKVEEQNAHDPHAQHLKDAFGRRRELQLGIPSGNNAHRLLDVSPDLAKTIIVAHIEKNRAKLVEANECARIELETSKMREQLIESHTEETK